MLSLLEREGVVVGDTNRGGAGGALLRMLSFQYSPWDDTFMAVLACRDHNDVVLVVVVVVASDEEDGVLLVVVERVTEPLCQECELFGFQGLTRVERCPQNLVVHRAQGEIEGNFCGHGKKPYALCRWRKFSSEYVCLFAINVTRSMHGTLVTPNTSKTNVQL